MERSLLLQLYATNNKSGQLVERAAAAADSTSEDYAFLSIVALLEPVTPTEISRQFGLSLSTVLFRAGRNVDLGHVERVTHPRDGRSFHLRLTPAGRSTWHRAGTELGRLVKRLAERLDRPFEEIHGVLIELETAIELELAADETAARR